MAEPGPFEWTRTVRAYLLVGVLVALLGIGSALFTIERRSGDAGSTFFWLMAGGLLPAWLAFAFVLGVMEGTEGRLRLGE